MLKRILLIIAVVVSFGQSLYSADYYNYGQWRPDNLGGTYFGAGGFIDKNGKLGEKGGEYVLFTINSTAYIYKVETKGDPNRHPDNPNSTGKIAEREFTFISKHTTGGAHNKVFYVDDTGIYQGAISGIQRWNFDWSDKTIIVTQGVNAQTFTRNIKTGEWWAGDTNRRIYKWNDQEWEYQFTYPNLGGGHHDGMTIANDTLFVSDMTSDFIATYKLDAQGNVVNPSEPDHIYSYTAKDDVEGMGMGPNNHIWITAYQGIYEVGGGKLQEQLAECSQSFQASSQWQMLSSKCDINASTAFNDTVVMKMDGEKLVVMSSDTNTTNYYNALGYDTNDTINLSRGEGFWVRAERNDTVHRLNGDEHTTMLGLKKDTTRFIGFAEYHEVDLDETFGDKPVKEIRYYNSNVSRWQKWQPNHVDTNLTTIKDGHGFYICMLDDMNISLPNLKPIADAGLDINAIVGQSIVLDAFKSYDKDGQIISYAWREGNTTLSNDSNFTIDSLGIGWHKVQLSVYDDDGDSATDELLIRISKINVAPTVDLGDDRNILLGETLAISPDVNETDGYILIHEWSLDGNLFATTPYIELSNLPLGEHVLSIQVIDNDLGKATDSIVIHVHQVPDNTPPVLTVLGANPMVMTQNSQFVDPGAIAVDDRDGNLSVDVNGSVDSSIIGEYILEYSAKDSAENSVKVQREVIVQKKSANKAPTVDAGEDRTIMVDTTLTLKAIANDSDGDIVSYEWKHNGKIVIALQGMTVDNLSIGKHVFTAIVKDNQGAMATDSVTIEVISKQKPDTTPPVITILGANPAVLNVGDNYSDAGATAVDDRDGNVSVGTSYSFNTGVAGVYEVTYTAQDKAGNKAIAKRSVLVKKITYNSPDTTPPLITLLGANPLIVMRSETFVDPGVIVIDDRDGQLGYKMQHNVNVYKLGEYSVTYMAEDKAGNKSEANRTVYVKDPKGNRKPIAIAGDDKIIGKENSVVLDASMSYDEDGHIDTYSWKLNDKVISSKVTCSLDALEIGTYTVTLTVIDNEGATSSDDVTVRVTDPSDVTPPIAMITSPSENSKVTMEAEIKGTASDANLAYYTLSLSPVGKNTYTEFARGTSSVSDDVLGKLDVTTRRNGIYDIKLTVVDDNGAGTTAYTKVIIEGKAKIGNFSFTVTDFDIQVGGIPVQVNRTYSTLQRFEKLDFTYAWSIDYQNVKVEENTHPGKEWKMTADTLIGSCFKFDKQHIVNISMPDGSTESFEFKFERECGHYFAGSFYDAPKLYALNGSEAKLEALGVSDVIAMYNTGTIIDGSSLQPYNPNRYKLTLSNGMAYEVIEGVGIKKIISLLNDTLTYENNGILSSRGESLTFERDNQNRIIKITDLANKSMIYHYNQNDNLDYVIDQLDQKTTYKYQEGHLLEEYYDPSGLRLTKNFYDEAGRLIKIQDADGNIVEFSHDIDGRQEVIKDKLGRTSVYVYDDKGNVLNQTNPLGEITTYTYNSRGDILTTIDALGNTIINSYDSRGNLLTITDALENEENISYNSRNSPLIISDKNGNTMSMVYNSYNDVRSISTAKGAITTYYYDKYGNKIESTNEYNQTTNYVYDEHYITLIGGVSSKGNLLKETQPNGTTIDHTYDDSSNLLTTNTTYTKIDGTTAIKNSSNTYDSFNRLLSHTDELGNTSTNSYDVRGNKVSTIDAEGRITSYEYTSSKKVKKVTYPDGTTESKNYDVMDNLLSETNQEGETTSYEYDNADRLVKTTYPDGTITTLEYDVVGRTTSTTDQRGNTTTYEYDAVGNKLSQIDVLGNKTTFTYDAQGNILTVTDALKQITIYAYNELNQKVKTTYADGTSIQETTNISGFPSSKIDELGQSTSYGYDTSRTMPLLNKVTLANNAITSYSYDSEGKKIVQTDALDHSTTWTYKPTGELARETLPQGEQKTFTYDDKGKQTQITDYANKAQKFIYDSYDRLVRIELADGSTTTYAYTPSGRVKTITDVQGTIANTYDAMGRLKTQTNPSGETITYTYDEVGNITKIETPQTSISKTYDALNRLKTVTDAQGTVTYDYDAIGRQTKVTFSNGMTTGYSYDARNRITNIVHKKSDGTVLQSFAYTLDAVGNRTKIVEHSDRTVDYEYNTVNQLTQEVVTNDPNGNNTTTLFTYDVVGNMLTKIIDGVDTSYSYNDNDQLITQGSVTFTYDANGNLVAKDDTTYEYDDKNRIIKVITPTDTIEYSYDANDNRIAKTTSNGTTTYLIDANTPYAQVITETQENGTSIAYTYGNDLLSDGSHTFLTDALGSTRGLVDSSENLTDIYNYTPYGKLVNHTGDSKNSFLFTGEQFDTETEDYYFRSRYYASNSGRFLSRDNYDGATGNPITQNHYLYGNANPLSYVDPTGNFSMVSTGFGVATSSLLYTIPNSTKFIGKGVTEPHLFTMLGPQGNLFIPVAITTYIMSIGLELRNEAIFSISYNIIHGSTRESMDLAYKKYAYSVSLIQMSGLFIDGVREATGEMKTYNKYAKSIIDYERGQFSGALKKYMNASGALSSEIKSFKKDPVSYINSHKGDITTVAKKMLKYLGDALSK